MHYTLFPFPLASMFGFGAVELMGFGIPIAGMILGGIMGITAMYFKHQQNRLRHEMVRLALEKGQPIPDFPGEKEHRRIKSRDNLSRHDLRGGLILIGIGAGLYLFFVTVGAPEARFIGAIPGFIGVALLLHALLDALLPRKNTTPEDRPPQS